MKSAIRLGIVLCMIFTSFYLWLQLDDTAVQKPASDNKTDEEKSQKEEDPKEEAQIMVQVMRSDGSTEEIELERYLLGVVGSEMPANFELEALKAQAVAARTFVKQRNFQVDDSTSSQVYTSEEELKQVWSETYDERMAKISRAVQETKSEILTYQGEAISAVFFSSTPGKTANSNEYWENDTPYLKSVDSHWDNEVNDGNQQEVSFTVQDFSSRLGFLNPVTQIQTPQYYETGYVKEIQIDQIVFTGREIREKLGLRSSSFEIKRDGDTIIIITRGFGHGIGMSQYGAQGMALEGSTYDEILKHYFTGVEITKIKV